MLDPRTPYCLRWEKSDNLSVVIAACIDAENRLCYYDYERGHMMDGKVKEELPSGIIFESIFFGLMTLTPLTLEEFDEHFRPWMDEYLSGLLEDMGDISFWYHREAGIV